MHWDGTITLGNVLSAVAFLVGLWAAAQRTYYSLDKRANSFEATISNHAKLLEEHARRMERQDDQHLKLMGDIQRILGRLDGVSVPAAGRPSESPTR